MPVEYNSIGGNSPDEYYRDLAQAFLDASWDNTAAKSPENGGDIYEQDSI